MHRYYVSQLYGSWTVFRDGIQFATGFATDAEAKDWLNRIVDSAKFSPSPLPPH